MIALTYHSSDARLAGRIQTDLRERGGYTVGDGVPTGSDHVLIPILSPAAVADAGFMTGLYRAFDSGQRVIPVLAVPVELPGPLDHLDPVDFTSGDADKALNALKDRVAVALSPEAGLPARVRTPRVQASNRRVGYVLVALIAFIFAVSTYLLATGIIAMPQEEYNDVDTEAARQRDMIIGPTMEYLSTILPRGTDQAAAFPSTLQAIPTVLRPFVALTATEIYHELADMFATQTPVDLPADAPESTPTPAAAG